MKFLNGLLPSISVRLALISMLAFALLWTGCESSYANTITQTSPMPKTSPIDLSTRSNPTTPSAGPAFGPGRRSTASSERPTSFTGFETRRHSVTDLRSGCSSEDPTDLRSSSSRNSIISISRSSEITPTNPFDAFSLNDISKTVPHFSDANRRTSSQTFAMPPATSSRTLLIDRLGSLFKPQFRGSAIGRTSALLPRRRSNWLESWQRWTPGPQIYARHSMESLYVSAWHRQRSRDSISYRPVNLPRSFTSRQ